MSKELVSRPRRVVAGAALCLAVLLAAVTPKPAQAWWGPGWGWRGGIAVALPPVVVGAPVYPPPYYPPYVPAYAPAYAYPAPYWRWVPEHRAPNGVVIAGHWVH